MLKVERQIKQLVIGRDSPSYKEREEFDNIDDIQTRWEGRDILWRYKQDIAQEEKDIRKYQWVVTAFSVQEWEEY